MADRAQLPVCIYCQCYWSCCCFCAVALYASDAVLVDADDHAILPVLYDANFVVVLTDAALAAAVEAAVSVLFLLCRKMLMLSLQMLMIVFF